MGDLSVDPVTFWERLSKLHKTWNAERQQDNSVWKGADALVIDSGGLNDDEVYSKSASLQNWLLGIEFTNTVIIVASRSVHVLTDGKKAALLEPLRSAENATLPLDLIVKDKTDKNKANHAKLIAGIRASHAGATVACLNKEKPLGDFAALWRAALAAEEGLAQVELAPALALLLASKDSAELNCIKRAAVFSAVLLTKQLVPRIEGVIDEEARVSHEALAQETEDAFGDPKKLGLNLSAENLEPCYSPIIQSGGAYNLKPSAYSNNANLASGGTITLSLGARFKSYCSNVGRTLLINPSKEQEKNYKLLSELQIEAIDALKVGEKLSAVHAAVLSKLRNKAAHLEKHLTRDCGFAMGLEFREAALLLNAKCEARVKPGMVFNVAVGLADLEAKDVPDASSRKYALFLSDTVLVSEAGANEVITAERAPKAWKDVSYYLNDDEEEEAAKPKSRGRGNVEILESRTRGKDNSKKHVETNEALSGHQGELEARMREEALERLRNGGASSGTSAAQQDTPVAYRDLSQFPNASASGATVRTNQTYVDQRNETVLLPVFGRLVPFHVSTIKSVSKHEEGAWTFLRINFVAPAITGAAQQMPPEAGADAHFIREVTLKAKVATNLNATFRLIKELRKRVVAREKQVALEADLVTQDAIQLIRTGKVHRLRDVHVRPNVGGKKAAGTLELHTNGLRFQAPRGEKLDLLFNNIKLAFYQPAEKEILVLLHFHLHNPIMIGKKKTKDVQFYVEVMEASYALDNARRSGYDPDELEEEQRERQLRNRMNQEFSNFSKKIEDQAKDLEFDIPYRELGFYGVPPHNKSTSFIMPAVNALVELTEPPWFVMPLSDIEIAHFERVVYGLKNFDLVLVFKDFSEKPLHVNAINIEHLDALKTWLDSCNIKFYEGTANLNWNAIMKNINDTGIEGFYEDGGWKFLNMQGSSDEEEEDPDDAESDFEPSGSESEEEEASDGSDEDFTDESDGSEEELGSDESEGQDWDEAEEAAEKDDKKRAREREAKEARESAGQPKKKKKK